MLQSSLSKCVATCVVAILTLASTVNASAAPALLRQSQSLVVSGCGTARIDGVIVPKEWGNATQVPVRVNVAGGTTMGTLYVMNDNLNLYLAFRFQSTALDDQDGLVFDFDNDNDGVWPEEGDDVLVKSTQLGFFYDGYRNSLPPNCTAGSVPDCVSRDTTGGGVQNGEGALSNDGTYTMFEMSHELNSGDIGHDFALGAGSVVGFHMALFITQAGVLFDTEVPVGAVAFDRIQIASCAPRPLGGCGTATIDGLVNPAEWATAGTYDMTVRTPHGGTTPARLYVMNDAFNLYLGFRFARNAADGANSLEFHFDNNNSGVAKDGDDGIATDDLPEFKDFAFSSLPPCPSGALCSVADTALGGTTDGAGVFTNDGTYSMYEMSHPLNSGDANDFALKAFNGTTVGYFLFLRMIASPGATPADFGDTSVPGGSRYAQIAMCEPSPLQSLVQLSDVVSRLRLPAKTISELQKSLDAAQQNIRAGKQKQAANDLSKFTKDVRKLVGNGSLSSATAAQLIAAADAIMQKL